MEAGWGKILHAGVTMVNAQAYAVKFRECPHYLKSRANGARSPLKSIVKQGPGSAQKNVEQVAKLNTLKQREIP